MLGKNINKLSLMEWRPQKEGIATYNPETLHILA